MRACAGGTFKDFGGEMNEEANKKFVKKFLDATFEHLEKRHTELPVLEFLLETTGTLVTLKLSEKRVEKQVKKLEAELQTYKENGGDCAITKNGVKRRVCVDCAKLLQKEGWKEICRARSL